MCSRAGARSVAAMRPSLLRLTAAAGATAAVLAASPARARRGRRLRRQRHAPATRSSSRPIRKLTDAAVDRRSPGAPTAATARLPGRRRADARRARRRASRPARSELLVSRNAKGRFAGTQLAAADLGAAVAAVSVEVDRQAQAASAPAARSRRSSRSPTRRPAPTVTSCQTSTSAGPRRARPGIIYGGTTSQGEPIVVRLNAAAQARQRRDHDLGRALHAATGYFRVPDHFVNFAGQAHRRASATRSATTSPIDAGGKRHFDYAHRRPRDARRRPRARCRSRSPTPTPPARRRDSCDTGGVTWKAATG